MRTSAYYFRKIEEITNDRQTIVADALDKEIEIRQITEIEELAEYLVHPTAFVRRSAKERMEKIKVGRAYKTCPRCNWPMGQDEQDKQVWHCKDVFCPVSVRFASQRRSSKS